ncbi:uncharacterized protein LOC141719352 [Apium graveolens]|uniref:uncharacterized protein LOC141719352 n=1 Tax=Apium graveolens TaxID=4045 RepID=UPI003D798CE7
MDNSSTPASNSEAVGSVTSLKKNLMMLVGSSQLLEAVGQFGPGYIPPTQYQLREPLLKQAVETTKETGKKQEKEWNKSGCSIMIDAWADRKRRSIKNLCVNYKLGTTFLSSIESSTDAHIGKYIFDYVDKWIEEVGSKNVIQGRCQSSNFVIDKSKELTIFIYAHHKTLSLMRKFTKKRDIVRPGITRFASSFLTMQSMLEKQKNLKFMFLSKEWLECKWSSTAKGTKIYRTIVSETYWQALSMCVEIFKPLVKVLRLVDGDWRPSMGFVYGELKDAKKEIIHICKGAADMYEPILDIIESKSKGRLYCLLHLAGYLLNPYFFYRDDEAQTDPKCMEALLTCVESFFTR